MNDTARKILVTGGTGFVGQNLIPALAALGHTVISPSRADLGSIDGNTDWSAYLDDIDTVIHLAGRAHVMKESAANPIDLYRAVNLHGTDNLARQAADASVRRFIFISSVKVMGEASSRPLSAADTPAPVDPYGVSKAEAEEALLKYAGRLEIVSLRPPLVYGPGVKGNFIALLKLTARGYPLPLGAIRNRRSMIYVKNLVSAIIHSINCETGTYLPSDGQDLSTPDLFRLAGKGYGTVSAFTSRSCHPVANPRFSDRQIQHDPAADRIAHRGRGSAGLVTAGICGTRHDGNRGLVSP